MDNIILKHFVIEFNRHFVNENHFNFFLKTSEKLQLNISRKCILPVFPLNVATFCASPVSSGSLNSYLPCTARHVYFLSVSRVGPRWKPNPHPWQFMLLSVLIYACLLARGLRLVWDNLL